MFVVYFYDYQECDDGPYGFWGVDSESDAQEQGPFQCASYIP